MNYLQIFAHAEDLHDNTTSDLEHILTSLPVALPLFIAVNLLIFAVCNRYKQSALLPALLFFNLIIGFFTYSLVPVVSIIAITLGILLALAVSLTLLAKG